MVETGLFEQAPRVSETTIGAGLKSAKAFAMPSGPTLKIAHCKDQICSVTSDELTALRALTPSSIAEPHQSGNLTTDSFPAEMSQVIAARDSSPCSAFRRRSASDQIPTYSLGISLEYRYRVFRTARKAASSLETYQCMTVPGRSAGCYLGLLH